MIDTVSVPGSHVVKCDVRGAAAICKKLAAVPLRAALRGAGWDRKSINGKQLDLCPDDVDRHNGVIRERVVARDVSLGEGVQALGTLLRQARPGKTLTQIVAASRDLLTDDQVAALKALRAELGD